MKSEQLVADFLACSRAVPGIATINDFGCSSSRIGPGLQKAGFDVLLVDACRDCLNEEVLQSPGPQLHPTRFDKTGTGGQIRDADWGLCFGFLESIPDNLLDSAIRNIALCSECAYFFVSSRQGTGTSAGPSSSSPVGIRPAEDWIRRFKRCWAYVEQRPAVDSGLAFLCRGRFPRIGALSGSHSSMRSSAEPSGGCVTTYYDPAYSSIGDLSAATIRKYCDVHGIPFERPDVNVRHAWAAWATWTKLDVVRVLFERGYASVIWIDADAAFARFGPDLRRDLDGGRHLSMVKHYVEGREVPNAGIFVIQNTPWSRALLSSLVSLKAIYGMHPWGENAALLLLLGYHNLLGPSSPPALEEEELERIQWLDVRWNSIPGICESPAPVIQHYAGHSMLSRTLGLQYLAAKAQVPDACPSCQFQLGIPLFDKSPEIAGWHGAEEYRWSSSTEATIRVLLQPGQNAIEIEALCPCSGYYWADIWMDSLPVGSMIFSGAFSKTFAFDLPDTSPGWKTLKIQVPFLWKSVEPEPAANGRGQGVAIRSIRLFGTEHPLGLTVVLARYELIDPRTKLYSSWLPSARGPLMVIREYDLTWEPPPNTDLLVTHEHFAQPELTLLRRTMERNVPVLLLADGIAEYRNTWEVPDRVPGQQFQPIMGHKIACLGPTQAELYESWGNAGRCEVVGYPSFDPLAGRKKACREQSGAFRILVMTARNPYFTPEHHELLCRGLSDLQAWLMENPTHGGRPIEVNWRLTADLEQQFHVANHKRDFYACPLEEIAAEMDAVITTPSTAMLVPMLMGVPTALLDYFGRPLYVQAAWRISERGQIGEALSAMLDSDPERMRVQRLILHEALFLGQPACERLRLLMEAMRRAGRHRRESGGGLRLPYRILGGTGALDAPDEDLPEYSAEDRVAVLRREIMHLQRAYDCDSLLPDADRRRG